MFRVPGYDQHRARALIYARRYTVGQFADTHTNQWGWAMKVYYQARPCCIRHSNFTEFCSEVTFLHEALFEKRPSQRGKMPK